MEEYQRFSKTVSGYHFEGVPLKTCRLSKVQFLIVVSVSHQNQAKLTGDMRTSILSHNMFSSCYVF